jgi:dipeptidase E
MNVLMISSSRYQGGGYLDYSKAWLLAHIGDAKEILFIPFAGVTISWDAYTQMVQEALPMVKVVGIHQTTDPKTAINQAQAILVGGGNTFNLLHTLYEQDLVELIKTKVESDTPYIGWSAGTNICGLSLRTTNDMPIVQPASFETFGFVNAQLNPHYTDEVVPNFHGETRDQRIAEFCMLHPTTPVIGIREGSALLLRNNKLSILGDLPAVAFESHNKQIIPYTQDLSEYL